MKDANTVGGPAGPRVTLLMGMTPGRATCEEQPLAGPAGGRLARLLGWSLPVLLARFPRRNLLDEWPGPSWRPSDARGAARAVPLPDGAVLLGRAVADAYGLPRRLWARWTAVDLGAGPVRVAVLPHPSGRCRAWNDPATREACRTFLLRHAPAGPRDGSRTESRTASATARAIGGGTELPRQRHCSA